MCKSTISTTLILLAAALLGGKSDLRGQSFNGAPDSLSFQGYLTTNAGDPVPDGAYSIQFSFYQTPTIISKLWSETQTIQTQDGVYSVVLGRVSGLSAMPFYWQLWLGVKVGSDPEIVPRIPLTAAPYALSLRNFRVIPEGPDNGPSIMGGWSGNSVWSNAGNTISGGGGPPASGNLIAAEGFATIGGGGKNTIESDGYTATLSGGFSNTVGGVSATVGGGSYNTTAGQAATVAGGNGNTAGYYFAAIGGGIINIATGYASTVPGGDHNAARGNASFASGYRARANHEGSFVWSDRTVSVGDSLSSTGANQFIIGAAGGVGIGTNAPAAQLDVRLNSTTSHPQLLVEEAENGDFGRIRLKNSSNGNYWDLAGGSTNNGQFNIYTPSGRGNLLSFNTTGDPIVAYNGAKLTNAGVWANNSSRSLKTDFRDIEARAILDKLASLPVREWRYKVEPETTSHIGPMSQDFREAFGLGDDPETIGTVDADGVALAAIKGLYEVVQEQAEEIARLKEALGVK